MTKAKVNEIGRRSILLGVLAGMGVWGLATTPAVKGQATTDPQIVVRGETIPQPTPHDDWKAKLDHIMSEVSGTEITVTKKATVIKLDQQPTGGEQQPATAFHKSARPARHRAEYTRAV